MASGTERWLILPKLGEERVVPDVSVLRRGTDRTAHGREEERCAMVVGGGGRMRQADDASVVWCGSVGDRSVSRSTRCVQCVWGVGEGSWSQM
jgi:hypothetical protein